MALPPGAPEGLSVFYPGPGHAADKLVAGFGDVLFGGCLIRPAHTKDLGNTADADVGNWADAVRAVSARFPNARTVMPSHGMPDGRTLLDHPEALAIAAVH